MCLVYEMATYDWTRNIVRIEAITANKDITISKCFWNYFLGLVSSITILFVGDLNFESNLRKCRVKLNNPRKKEIFRSYQDKRTIDHSFGHSGDIMNNSTENQTRDHLVLQTNFCLRQNARALPVPKHERHVEPIHVFTMQAGLIKRFVGWYVSSVAKQRSRDFRYQFALKQLNFESFELSRVQCKKINGCQNTLRY